MCFQQDFEENMSADRPGSQLGFSGNQVLPQDYSEAFRENIPKEGLWTTWHENGQKREEETYKNGKLVSTKYYNSNGEEAETLEEAGK